MWVLDAWGAIGSALIIGEPGGGGDVGKRPWMKGREGGGEGRTPVEEARYMKVGCRLVLVADWGLGKWLATGRLGM